MKKIIKFIINLIILLFIILFGLVAFIIYKTQNGEPLPDYLVNAVSKLDVVKQNDKLLEDIETPNIVQSIIKDIQEVSNTKEIDYSNINVDKYFYNQLDENTKLIYKALEANKENMKTGTYKIELGTSFTDILSKENGQELLGKYYQSAIETYNYDNPDVFYLSSNKMYLNIETIKRGKNEKYNVYINNGNEANYLTNEFNNKEEIDDVLQEIEKVRYAVIQNKKDNNYENIKMVHDYLVQTIDYDTSMSNENIYNICGALVNKKCVCEGYAKSFKYLMDALDIPCTIVIGKAKNSAGNIENHAWNYVKLDGKWYGVDVTWDDPVIIGNGSLLNNRKYKYFLLGEEDMNKDHEVSYTFSEGGREYKYPTLSNQNYK